MKGAKGFFKPGILAMLSIAAIAVILVFAHFDRRAKACDQLALHAANRVHAMLASQLPAGQDQADQPIQRPVSMDELLAQGLSLPPGVMYEMLPGPEGQPQAVRLWHPDGLMQYKADASGVKEDYQ